MSQAGIHWIKKSLSCDSWINWSCSIWSWWANTDTHLGIQHGVLHMCENRAGQDWKDQVLKSVCVWVCRQDYLAGNVRNFCRVNAWKNLSKDFMLLSTILFFLQKVFEERECYDSITNYSKSCCRFGEVVRRREKNFAIWKRCLSWYSWAQIFWWYCLITLFHYSI